MNPNPICPHCGRDDCIVPMPADTPAHIKEAYAYGYQRNRSVVCTCWKGQEYEHQLTGYWYDGRKWNGDGQVDHGWWDKMAEELLR